MKTYMRMAIPLLPGEQKPTYAMDDPPPGFRWETDEELRNRIKHDLERDATTDGTDRP